MTIANTNSPSLGLHFAANRCRSGVEAFDKLDAEMDSPPSKTLRAGVAPPQRLAVDNLLVRRWEPLDLDGRLAALTASFADIHPWMAWLAAPTTLEQQRAYGETVSASWPDPEGGCQYGIFDADGTVVGAIGLHDRLGPPALEIGYWCHSGFTGRGVVTRTGARLTEIALALDGVERVEIHCDEANVRSAAVARRLGYRLDRTEQRPVRAPAESGVGMIWVSSAVAP